MAVAVWLAGCAAAQPPSGASGSLQDATPATATAAVVRSVLAAGVPSSAPGNNLELVRYTIAPHTSLAPHHHPGMQLALIESGTLTYSFIDGTVVVHETGGST